MAGSQHPILQAPGETQAPIVKSFPTRLILASASPQRRKLLSRLKIPFAIVPSRVREACAERDPAKLTVILALRKALAVARKRPRAMVLGADTVVWCRGRCCLKPRGRRESEEMLAWLNGRWQEVHTGLALVGGGGKARWTASAVTRVLARRLSPRRLADFAGRHHDKAGGYAVQDRRDPFIKRIVGEKSNVIGLPLKAVRRLFRLARASRPRPPGGKKRSAPPSARRPRRR